MRDAIRLYVEAVASSAAGLGAFATASAAETPLSAWLMGAGGIASLGAVFAYGKLAGRVEHHSELLSEIRDDVKDIQRRIAHLEGLKR